MQINVKIINKLKYWRAGLVMSLHTGWTYLFAKSYGIRLGHHCSFLGLPSFLRAPGSVIEIGNGCQFRSGSRSNLFGLNHPCIISTHAAEARIVIGENSGFSGATIGSARSIRIGNNVLVGANAVVTDFDWHSMDPQNRNTGPILSKEIIIEDNVWIGANAMILKGVTIGRNTVIGAGSVVTSNMPADAICAGNPCRMIRLLNQPAKQQASGNV
jgi:acetyltransferase-like isoleucine patch superfamily enzyme